MNHILYLFLQSTAYVAGKAAALGQISDHLTNSLKAQLIAQHGSGGEPRGDDGRPQKDVGTFERVARLADGLAKAILTIDCASVEVTGCIHAARRRELRGNFRGPTRANPDEPLGPDPSPRPCAHGLSLIAWRCARAQTRSVAASACTIFSRGLS